jgi:hypothetical protein
MGEDGKPPLPWGGTVTHSFSVPAQKFGQALDFISFSLERFINPHADTATKSLFLQQYPEDLDFGPRQKDKVASTHGFIWQPFYGTFSMALDFGSANGI